MNNTLKVLLVDDNHDTLDLLELFLFKDFEVLTAMNGFEGLKRAEEEIPDLIITDIMMPVMDGIRFFNNLKKQEKTNHIPVIAITSFVKKITRKSLLNMGFTGVVSKPLVKETVLETVRKAINLPLDKNVKHASI
ncbi:MAG: response regulator [Fibrobacter sp.]|jgi:CheY-like chemotaxis protein|nr:response regulator [Fibrobacter sp.]HON10896.1 response regulator [Chitinispirillaceae bacterium]